MITPNLYIYKYFPDQILRKKANIKTHLKLDFLTEMKIKIAKSKFAAGRPAELADDEIYPAGWGPEMIGK